MLHELENRHTADLGPAADGRSAKRRKASVIGSVADLTIDSECR